MDDIIVGYTEVNLEGRFELVRTQETNLGNWIADVFYTEFHGVDIVIQNSGALRCNMVLPKGPLTIKHIANLLPLKDHIVLIRLPGWIVKEALENAVSKYPALDGRFCNVSGLNFTWDAAKDAGSRVVTVQMWDGSQLDDNKLYTIALKYFLAIGRDGFTCFQRPEVQMLTDLTTALTMQ